MKRLLSIVALTVTLILGTGGSALAHELYVTTPAGEVLVAHPVAKKITPLHHDGTGSAASHGTNVACQAVGTDGPAIIYGGPYCSKP